jgi:hypothetical protein
VKLTSLKIARSILSFSVHVYTHTRLSFVFNESRDDFRATRKFSLFDMDILNDDDDDDYEEEGARDKMAVREMNFH